MHDPTDAVPVEVRPFPRSAQEVSAEPVIDGIIRLRLPLPYSPKRDGERLPARARRRRLVPRRLRHEHLARLDRPRARARPGRRRDQRTSSFSVCTHAHADHYGLASEVMQRSGCPLWARRDPRHRPRCSAIRSCRSSTASLSRTGRAYQRKARTRGGEPSRR